MNPVIAAIIATVMIVVFGFMSGHNSKNWIETTARDVVLCILWPVALLLGLGRALADFD